jgi:hypothetical protein
LFISRGTAAYENELYIHIYIYIYIERERERERALRSVLLTKYHSGDQVKKTEMGRTCGTCGERRGAYRALVGKPEGRRRLGRPRRRREDNIKMDLREIGWGSADWIDLAQDRDRWRALVYTVMNLRVL